MTGEVWTSDRRRKMIVGIYFDLHFDTADIAEELAIEEAKVLAILDEHRANELACDQLTALAGPKMPLSKSPDQGGATRTGGATPSRSATPARGAP